MHYTALSKEIARLNALKQLLNNTDYKAIKYAEGAISSNEYLKTKEQRSKWRAEINELEELISGS